ncbi:MAG: DUF502 domain-containing protein [Salibacteraceae bacterium]
MRKLVSFFFQGLLLVVPIVLTLYIVYKMFVVVDEILPYHPFPGSGVIIILVVITLIGILGNTLIARQLNDLFHAVLKKVPLLSTIYSAIKDLLSAFVGEKRKFNSPVLVKLSSESNIEKLGFITQDSLESIGMGDSKVAVYLPHSYAFSGNLFIVERENITPIMASSAEVMKFIVSGGVAIPGGNNDS